MKHASFISSIVHGGGKRRALGIIRRVHGGGKRRGVTSSGIQPLRAPAPSEATRKECVRNFSPSIEG